MNRILFISGALFVDGSPYYFNEIKQAINQITTNAECILLPPLKYQHVGQRLLNIFYKHVLGVNLKRKIREDWVHQRITKLLQEQNFTHLFVIGVDCLSHQTLALLAQNIPNRLAYLWDSIHWFPSVPERIQYFTKFFSFDPKDVAQFDLSYRSNLYDQEHIDETERAAKQSDELMDVFYIGMFDQRIVQNYALLEYLHGQGLHLDVCVYKGKNYSRLQKKYPLIKFFGCTT